MFLRNTSKYPDAEVKALIDFVAKQGFDLTRVCVNVKNCQYAFAGRAYQSVPRAYSNAPKTAKRLVVLRIGSTEEFPTNNRLKKTSWEDATEEQYLALIARGKKNWAVRGTHMVDGQEFPYYKMWVCKDTEVSYGGKQSPLIEYHDWKEALVGLAAHEFNHIRQYDNKSPSSESRCEKKALEVLELYREWARTRPIVEDPQPMKAAVKSKRSDPARKLDAAQKMLKLWATREKRAVTIRKKWQKKVAHYEKRVAASEG